MVLSCGHKTHTLCAKRLFALQLKQSQIAAKNHESAVPSPTNLSSGENQDKENTAKLSNKQESEVGGSSFLMAKRKEGQTAKALGGANNHNFVKGLREQKEKLRPKFNAQSQFQ